MRLDHIFFFRGSAADMQRNPLRDEVWRNYRLQNIQLKLSSLFEIVWDDLAELKTEKQKLKLDFQLLTSKF